MPVLKNIGSLTTPTDAAVAAGKQGQLSCLSQAAVVWKDEYLVWIGREADLPAQYKNETTIDARGALVIPGLVDCHTHLGFGGWRENEFVMKCEGQSYEAIAQAGGGIVSTVSQTRGMTEHEIAARCLDFLSKIVRLGITTVEAKSGYGLDLENELKLLRAYREVRGRTPLTLVSTLLAAHTIPIEYKANRKDYITLIVDEILPRVAKQKLASFCDIFVERIAFSAEEARQILTAAKTLGLAPKLHVDQLSDGDGAALAASVGATSADHLEYTNEVGIAALAAANTVAVSLPIASLYTRQPPLNGRKFIQAGVAVAVATDFNPGSAPSYHLPLALMLACTMNRLTPAEALAAGTLVAAKAVALDKEIGSIEVGKRADMVLMNSPSVEHWLYHFEPNNCLATIKNGVQIYEA